MKAKVMGCIGVFIVLAAFQQPTFGGQTGTDDGLRIFGAGLLGTVVEAYSKDYTATVPGWDLSVIGVTTGKGFRSLIAGDADMVMASRSMTDAELEEARTKGIQIAHKKLGSVCLAVITNSGNPVQSLTMDQLRKIFTGRITNWKEVGGMNEPILVTTRAVPETGAGVVFQQVILQGEAYAPGQMVMDSYRRTMLIASEKHSIGYIPTSSIFYGNRCPNGVKVLSLKADEHAQPISPGTGVVQKTEYPVTIPFYYYWREGTPKTKAAEAFTDFCARVAERNGLSKAMAVKAP